MTPIERIEAATEGSRELDLAIHLALFPDGEIAGWMKYPRGLSSREGYSWDISGASLIFEKRTADGRCPYNGGVPLPVYSTSIDAALTLLPPPTECWWSIEQMCAPDSPMRSFGGAGTYRANFGYWRGKSFVSRHDNVALALLAAILRARQAEPRHDES